MNLTVYSKIPVCDEAIQGPTLRAGSKDKVCVVLKK